MTVRFFQALLVFVVLLVPVSRAHAVAAATCDPHSAVCVNQPCDVPSLGTTTMDYGTHDIIACLKDPSNNPYWRTMSPMQYQLLKKYVGVTAASYVGATAGGYAGADAKCVAQFGAGARVCSTADLANGIPPLGEGGWINTFLLQDGTQGQVNDCGGWQNYDRGVHWRADRSIPSTDPCGNSNPHRFVCCK